jgi:hypothetical protein
MNFAPCRIDLNQMSRPMRTMMLRILFLTAAVAAATGGFVIGASSYDLDRAAALRGVPGVPPPLL